MRRTVAEDARHRAEQRRLELSSDIDAAFKRAEQRLARAEESGDLHLVLRSQAAINKLLALRAKFAPKPKETITWTAEPKETKPFKSAVIYAEDTPADLRLFPPPATTEELAEAVLIYEVRFINRRPLLDIPRDVAASTEAIDAFAAEGESKEPPLIL